MLIGIQVWQCLLVFFIGLYRIFYSYSIRSE